ncbi:phage tail protein [Luteibacter sp. E-22]|uniref:phage tail protein n=1 Tax=Luteibacter sp. E-22 TaxID=3404050 RepID=UPI003CF71806
MSVQLPDGSVLSIEASAGTAKPITAITNANPAVATAAAHGFTDGDFVKITSGWNRLNGRVVRVKNSDTNTFQLEGVDTSDAQKFPAGSGVGSVQEVATWTQVTQVLEFSTSGGEQQFATYSFLEEDVEHQIPTTKSPQSIGLSIGDDISLPWYPILSAANDDRVPRAVRLQLPSGSMILYNGYATLNKTPTVTKGQVMALAATVSLVGDVTRYAA